MVAWLWYYRNARNVGLLKKETDASQLIDQFESVSLCDNIINLHNGCVKTAAGNFIVVIESCIRGHSSYQIAETLSLII